MQLVRFIAVILGLLAASPVVAGGLVPDRINQIIIQGRFATPAPEFLVVFSANRVTDERGRLVTSLPVATLPNVKSGHDHVAIRLYGKQATQPGRFDYFFGTLHDGERPWNNGDDFRWEDWEKCSPDVWDTHSLIFTTWIFDGRNPITQYGALSGNNKEMVWAHAPLKLPTADQFQGMTPEQVSEYDQKVFFGVPSGNRQ